MILRFEVPNKNKHNKYNIVFKSWKASTKYVATQRKWPDLFEMFGTPDASTESPVRRVQLIELIKQSDADV